MRASSNFQVMGGGLTILIVVAVALWGEFSESGKIVWNVILAAMLLALAVAAFLGQRYFRAHAGEIGEARFDTRNEGDR